MINNIGELKEFILWAKSQKLRAVKIGETSFEFSDLALIGDLPEATSATSDLSVPPSSKRLPDMTPEQLSEKEFEDTLFHSA